jgi:hypothetical protein
MGGMPSEQSPKALNGREDENVLSCFGAQDRESDFCIFHLDLLVPLSAVLGRRQEEVRTMTPE